MPNTKVSRLPKHTTHSHFLILDIIRKAGGSETSEKVLGVMYEFHYGTSLNSCKRSFYANLDVLIKRGMLKKSPRDPDAGVTQRRTYHITQAGRDAWDRVVAFYKSRLLVFDEVPLLREIV